MLKKLLAFTCLTLSISANSATLVVVGGELIGAKGVDVDGTLYDVTFTDGSCNELFNGCATFDINDEDTAYYAAHALLDQVFIGDYDKNASLTRGVEDLNPLDPPHWGDIYTPYAWASNGNLLFALARNYDGGPNNTYGSDFVEWDLERSAGWAGLDLGERGAEVYAQWTPSEVPVPAAAWLFGSAMLGLMGIARRKKA